MSTAKTGDSVAFRYTGTLSDGTQFDTSIGGDPMGANLGEGQLIPGFEAALAGMAEGDSKTIILPADEGVHWYTRLVLLEIHATHGWSNGQQPIHRH